MQFTLDYLITIAFEEGLPVRLTPLRAAARCLNRGALTPKDIVTNMHSDEYNNLKQLLENNAKTNTLLQANITANPQLKI